MSAVLSHPTATGTDVNLRLAFQKQLQLVTNKIHATNNVDEIMLDLSADIMQLFNADRLTIYSIGEDKQSIVSKIKTGLNSFKDLKLPIAEHSIAGYAAMSRKLINIKDVYDEAELKAVTRALARADHNLAQASRLLGISRPTLYSLLEKFHIDHHGE